MGNNIGLKEKPTEPKICKRHNYVRHPFLWDRLWYFDPCPDCEEIRIGKEYEIERLEWRKLWELLNHI